MKLFAAALLLFITLPSLAHAEAPTAIGTVVALEGTAKGSIGKALDEDDPVYFGETITTGNNTKMVVLLVDDTEITLGEEAELTIDEYVVTPSTPENNRATFNILKGAFLLTSGLVGKTDDPDVTINTAVGSIGLRGTTVWGGPIDGEYGVLVQMGEVDVYNEHGKVRLYPGQGSFVPSRDKSPRKIGSWDPSLTKRAINRVTLRDHKGVAKKLRTLKQQTRLRNQIQKKKKLRVQPR